MTTKLTKKTVVQLQNPWSQAVTEMTWGDIQDWCRKNVYITDQWDWMKHAKAAAQNDDAETLGKMIIGS